MTAKRVPLTVCICTHNRAELLRSCLEGIARQTSLDQAAVVVVANNCTDETADVVESFRDRIPALRSVSEPAPGLVRAWNRGLAEATTEFIAFLDDDAIPEPGWAAAVLDAFATTGADVVAGKVVPYWNGRRPWWASKELYPLVGGFDHGEGVCPKEELGPKGRNMAWRTAVLRKMGGFDVHLGLCRVDGKDLTECRGEDTEIGLKLVQGGYRVAYSGRAMVKHLTHGQNASLRGLRVRAVQKGRAFARIESASFDVAAAEDACVWATACAASCALRLHVRNAIVFYILAVIRRAAMQEFLTSNGRRGSSWTGYVRAAYRLRRGLAGLARRTAAGRPISPWER